MVAVEGQPVISDEEILPSNTAVNEDNNNDDIVDYYGSSEKSLIIPITSSATLLPNGTCQFIEIFPEEISSINPSTLSTVLRDERAPVKTWCEASLLYMRSSGSGGGGGSSSGGGNTHHGKEGCELLTLAVDNDDVMNGSNTTDRLRVLASAGIAALAHANRHAGDVGKTSTSGGGGGGGGGAGADIGSLLDDLLESSKFSEKQDAELREELRTLADSRFVKADNINQVNPMTWIGRGMLNLAQNKLDQARFFFENLTLRECGETLPALIGMAAVKFIEKDYSGALDLYSRAIRKYPHESGSVTRVGFGMACYRLGQVDRAKASFRRAHEMDAENVEALVALAVLEMSSLDGDVLAPREYRARAENVLKLLSMANVVDHTNAMVQNHLANHYFWKWTPVPGMVSVEQRSDVVRGNMVSSLEVGDRIRIGHEFETVVIAENNNNDMDENETENLFKIKDRWKIGSASNLKIWKKDYDRVVSLAKGAYNSTNMPEVQAESLYMLARVFHARGDMEQANKFYDKACLLSPELSPARFGLAQTLIWDEAYDEAAAHLRLLLGTCSNATDALAALGLLEVKAGKDRREAFMYLKKAIDLDPFNSDLVLIEALALQQQESDYPLSLDRYRKAVRLLKVQGKKVPADVLTNMGVLCHETKLYDEALDMYSKALKAVEAESNDAVAGGADENGDVTLVKHKENDLFWKYIDTDIRVESAAGDDKTSLIVSSSIGIKVGDNISLDGGIETTIKEVSGGDDGLIHLIVEDEVDLENSKSNLSVKRCNGRLRNPNSISIAFNLARLHESSGRIVPAVELHKAILNQHPAYVNSYLRLACIARDCGSLKDCSEWLKMAVAVAPGNPEVLTLVGNLHLSLCDWAPAQNVFDQLLQQKGKNPLVGFVYQIIGRRCAYPLSVPKVEAYSMLSLGNIYFNNLNTPNKYSKHLQHAADFYRRILQKDSANAYAANGLGTVLAEKGELFKAKEIFNRVREVSGDTLSDSLLNLGHIYLAQKKHPEALQMYQNYLGRTFNSAGIQTTSKSQEDDEAEVLLYIAFAYFDWARQTELFNNAKASPADERYQQCIQYIELAMKKSKRENCVLRYNWCLAKLQGANCVLQKVNRNIRRTAQEVKDALDGLEESLPILQTILQWKEEGRKVAISKGMLSGVVNQCKHNIDSAKSHLKEELKNEQDAERLRHFQRTEAEINEKQRALAVSLQKEKEAQEIEESELRAKKKMERVNNLLDGWKQAETASKKDPTPKKKKGDAPPGEVEDEAPDTSALFDDSEDEDEDDEDEAGDNSINKVNEPVNAEVPSKDKELFGDSSSDEDFLKKHDEQANKKRKLENSHI